MSEIVGGIESEKAGRTMLPCCRHHCGVLFGKLVLLMLNMLNMLRYENLKSHEDVTYIFVMDDSCPPGTTGYSIQIFPRTDDGKTQSCPGLAVVFRLAVPQRSDRSDPIWTR
jgi:hypothetical protein